MEMLNLSTSLILLSLIAASSSTFLFMLYQWKKQGEHANLPPGSMGWPLLGETMEMFSAVWKVQPEKFVMERLAKYAPHKVFKTSLFGENTIVMTGPSANKLIYSNETKLVRVWWSKSVIKVLSSDTNSSGKGLRKLMNAFVKPEALKRYVPVMDTMAKRHFGSDWEGKDTIKAEHVINHFTFGVACRLFFSIDDSAEVAKFARPFHDITSAIFALPIEIPGTAYYRGLQSSKFLQKKIIDIIRQRRMNLAEGKATPTQDILSHMMSVDDDGKYMTEEEITNMILGLLVGGHDTTTIVCTLLVKYLADYPHVYDLVFKEQMEIAKSKQDGELLNLEDAQKMKYTWNVACEVMRLNPIGQGSYREAITDFTFDGHQIPKGWKVMVSAYGTQYNPEWFPEPEKFDPSRFEAKEVAPYSFIPYGGGPRMCPGTEYARLEILVFIHNLVKRFKWDTIIPNEKFIVKVARTPAQQLPIRLHPHSTTY